MRKKITPRLCSIEEYSVRTEKNTSAQKHIYHKHITRQKKQAGKKREDGEWKMRLPPLRAKRENVLFKLSKKLSFILYEMHCPTDLHCKYITVKKVHLIVMSVHLSVFKS